MKVFEPHRMGLGVRVLGTGLCLPSHVVTNEELVQLGAPLTAEEIVKLSGIVTRRWVTPGQATSDLAREAALHAMRAGTVKPEQVDRLILATVSPDHPSPATACLLQQQLGLGQVPAYDVTATCSGFVYALEQAARAVCTGDKAVLAVAADVRSKWLNLQDRATCALFGDGAGAAVVAPGPAGEGLLAVGVAVDGTGFSSVQVPMGGSREPTNVEGAQARRHTIHMQDGPAVYMNAVEGMLTTAEQLLAAVGLTFKDVDYVVPHQANKRLLERWMRLARVPAEKVHLNVDRLGNISGASTAVALHEALTQRRVKAGDRVLILAAGAGYTAGAALYRVDQALLDAAATGD